MIRLTTFLAAISLSFSMIACGASSSSNNDNKLSTEEQVEEATPVVEEVEAVEEFGPDTTIPTSIDKPIVFDFNAVWCPPCQRFKPIFHDVAKEYSAKARFISVDVDNNKNIARQFEVSSIPQISILKTDGQIVSSVGYMDKEEFINFLNTNL